jgi:hypothetical protein
LYQDSERDEDGTEREKLTDTSVVEDDNVAIEHMSASPTSSISAAASAIGSHAPVSSTLSTSAAASAIGTYGRRNSKKFKTDNEVQSFYAQASRYLEGVTNKPSKVYGQSDADEGFIEYVRSQLYSISDLIVREEAKVKIENVLSETRMAIVLKRSATDNEIVLQQKRQASSTEIENIDDEERNKSMNGGEQHALNPILCSGEGIQVSNMAAQVSKLLTVALKMVNFAVKRCSTCILL